MKNFTKPIIIDEEIIWNKTQSIISKTDANGTIEYVNENFCEVSGYDDVELMGSPHNIIRHPDMPKIIFKIIWENLKNNTPLNAIVKNLCKCGRYYWVKADFKIMEDEEGNPTYFSVRKSIDSKVVKETIEPLYKELLHIENENGAIESEQYLTQYLAHKNLSYSNFIKSVL